MKILASTRITAGDPPGPAPTPSRSAPGRLPAGTLPRDRARPPAATLSRRCRIAPRMLDAPARQGSPPAGGPGGSTADEDREGRGESFSWRAPYAPPYPY